MRIAAALVLAVVSFGAAGDPRVDAVFAEVAKSDSPGCAISVRRGGEVLHRGAYGMASLELQVPNTPDTVFHAGSIGKQITARAVLMLESEGKLALADSIRKYVPELSAWAQPVTLRHLLEHTSGVRDADELLWIAGGKDDARITEEVVMDLLARQRALNFAPGKQVVYSNTGYMLLAMTVARVSGEPFALFAKRRIFDPLGMTRTHFRDDYSSVIPNRATGYRRDGRPQWHLGVYLSDIVGSGGLFTTVDDLQRWLGHAELEMGVQVAQYRGHKTIGHEGRDFGYQADAVHLPELDLAIVTLCNARDLDAYTFARRVADLYLPARPTSPSPSVAPAPPPALPTSPFPGLFFNPSTLAIRQIDLRDGQLLWRGSTVLEPLAESRFRLAGQPTELLFLTPDELHVLNPGRPPAVYARVAPFGTAPLTDYTGTWRSDEVNATYEVTSRDGKLHFRSGPIFRFTAAPIFRDTFQIADGMLVRFHRNARGKVTQMDVSTNRARNVSFARTK